MRKHLPKAPLAIGAWNILVALLISSFGITLTEGGSGGQEVAHCEVNFVHVLNFEWTSNLLKQNNYELNIILDMSYHMYTVLACVVIVTIATAN